MSPSESRELTPGRESTRKRQRVKDVVFLVMIGALLIVGLSWAMGLLWKQPRSTNV
jgi:hypothetical protein